VNPYDIYNPPHLKYFENKPLVSTHLRLVKAMAVKLKRPEYLILGSSTAETGLDPNKLDTHRGNVYNLGLPGANIYEVMRYLQHAQSVKPLKRVVLVVNFFMFNAYYENRVDFDESILKVDKNENKNNGSINTLVSTLISFDALNASMETIKKQNSENVYQSNGQLMLNFREKQISKFNGYRGNFVYVESYNKETLFPSPQKKYSFRNSQNGIDSIQHLRRIVDICEKNNTQLTIVIAPEHVRLLEAYRLLGLWDKYEKWQVKITELIATHNEKNPKNLFQIWAFNKINFITTERIPKISDSKSNMKWFWDPFHFKNQLGNIIIDTIYFRKTLNNNDTISELLTKKNILSELKKNRLLLLVWESTNKKEIDEIKNNLNRS
jgi:hypothetical protein